MSGLGVRVAFTWDYAPRLIAVLTIGEAIGFIGCARRSSNEYWLEPTQAGEIRAVSVRTATPTSLANQRGKVVLLSFGYTSCSDICPTTLARMSGALQLLRSGANQVEVVYVSIDPERDTVPHFSEFMQAFDPRIEGWRVDPAQLGLVMGRYGVAAFKVPANIKHYLAGAQDAGADYSLDHTAAYWLIDRSGKLRARYSHDASSQAIADGMEKLLNG